MILALVLGLLYQTPPPGQLEFRFIGNMAFHITDGRTTLLSDFPYQSGYSGYMSWTLADVPPIVNGVCLITHRHADHFEPALFRPLTLRIIGPVELTRSLPSDRVLALGPRVALEDLVIEPIRTPHAGLEHYSYLVTWHGLRMYFTGDTEETAALVAARDLDVAFVSPWLMGEMARRGERVNARRVVCYHHQAGEAVPAFQDRRVPEQGESFRLPFRERGAPGSAARR
jgi:L-ascorbate metabolism protein UlaG (beta-lactamase superfamily)